MKKEGIAIPTILSAMSIMFVVGVAIVVLSSANLTTSAAQASGEKAYYAAEAGLAFAANEISKTGTAASPVTGTLQGASEKFSVEVFKGPTVVPGGPTVPANCFYLLSSGSATSGLTRKIGALVQKVNGDFEVGALADKIFAANADVDAFDSSKGAYGTPGAAVANSKVMGTNQITKDMIDISKANVAGTLVVGPGGDPDTVIKGYGKKYTSSVLPSTIVPPAITVPVGLPYTPDLTVSGATLVTPGEYGNLTVNSSGAMAALQADSVYVVGNLTVTPAAQLTLAGKNVTIYIKQSMSLADDAIFNSTKKSSNLKLISDAAANFFIGPGADAYCSVTAPNANVTLISGKGKVPGAELYGAIFAKQLKMQDCSFHFDTDLRKANTAAGGGGVTLLHKERL